MNNLRNETFTRDFDYSYKDFLSDFSSDYLYRQLIECDKELEKINTRIDTIRKRKQKLGIGYYFVKMGFKMKKAIKELKVDEQ